MGVTVQIMLLDVVFSLDSIITAVGMVEERRVMVTAILISIAFMIGFVKPIGDFVERHPTVKVLALSFLIMIGLVLIADGFGQRIPKGYIYAAMAFSVFVELINLWIRRAQCGCADQAGETAWEVPATRRWTVTARACPQSDMRWRLSGPALVKRRTSENFFRRRSDVSREAMNRCKS